ncbi:MAG: RsmD family RNA methyltransferase [Beijerinckiaceae bacterium]
MRIVAGRLKGRAILGPKSDAIRPTSDRLRETLFNVLHHGLAKHGVENCLLEARVLDLFAGTGALAIEAMSQGAAYGVMVDDGTESRGLLRHNVDTLGLGGVTRILRRDATKLGPVAPFDPFTLVFLDPPYGKGLGERALTSAITGGWLAENAIVVLEERAGIEVELPAGLTLLDQRKGGEGQIMILQFRATQ